MTSCFSTLVLLVSTVSAFAQEDPREARERLLRQIGEERVERSATGVEPLGTTELLADGGFEAGQAPGPGMGYSGTSGAWSWTTSDGMLNPVWTDPASHTGDPTPRTGAWCVYFTPFGPASNTISQQVTIPPGSTATLSFWVRIGTLETSSYSTYDTLSVRLTSTSGTTLATLATYSNLTPTPGFTYVQKSFNVSAWAGQTVRVHFASYNDSTRSTVFLLDDVSLTATSSGGEPPSGFAGTWILPSSARTPGANAFWTTDLSVTNTGATPASVNVKFLGHDGKGASGPERVYTIPARSTSTWPDVLALMFGRETDWGPILVRSSVTALVAQGQTWTPAASGGGYGQSVPALDASETVGATARTLSGVSQDARFRTNVVLANMKETEAVVTLQVFRADGSADTAYTTTVGPLGFVQLNLANNFGVTNLSGGSVVVSSPTAGAAVGVYASVIDASTGDPRTILAR
ncbi:MAG: choice-of-anchor J domain-containing protein [Thermoanaerobaculia bacterium]